MAAGGEKPNKFGCLDAARVAVAFAVTVLILLVIVYAVVTVLRPGNVVVSIVNGYVPVKNYPSSSSSESLPLLLFVITVRVINPSGRVRIYYTDIVGILSGRINSSLPVEDFLMFKIDEFSVEQQNYADVIRSVMGSNESNSMPPEYFNKLFYGGSISGAMLKLNGSRIVETYSGHNDTAKPGVYYCQPVIVGGEEPEEMPADVQCSEHEPPSASS